MRINTPPAIRHMAPMLAEFTELMAAKLMVNAHKDNVADKDIPILLKRMQDEVIEFNQEIAKADLQGGIIDPNALEELSDISNFAFLLYQYLRQRGIHNAVERFIDEFYDIRPDEGRVYCKKTRSGSPLKPGDEVRGSTRRGRVYIRAQHAITGAALSVSRADLVWWKYYGEWPKNKLGYNTDCDNFEFVKKSSAQRETATKDAVFNLRAAKPKFRNALPFVSQYGPRGREGSANFGKWVYQRRHAFKLIRCGYYDTAEQAATQGLKDWKDKTRA